jgi:tetratricopeptide (TPR) repeat protein
VQIDAPGDQRHASPALLANLAGVLCDLHHLREATDLGERASAQARERHDEVLLDQALMGLAAAYRQTGQLERAAAVVAELEPRLERMRSPAHIWFALLAAEKAMLAAARGDAGTAGSAADNAVRLAEASTRRVEYLPQVLLQRADVLLSLGRLAPAEADARRAAALAAEAAGPGKVSSWEGRANLALGRALAAQAKPDEARSAFDIAVRHLEPTLGSAHPATRAARRLSAPPDQIRLIK